MVRFLIKHHYIFLVRFLIKHHYIFFGPIFNKTPLYFFSPIFNKTPLYFLVRFLIKHHYIFLVRFLIEIEFLDIFSKKKTINIKFHENLSSGSRVVPRGQTYRNDEDKSHFSQIFANATKKVIKAIQNKNLIVSLLVYPWISLKICRLIEANIILLRKWFSSPHTSWQSLSPFPLELYQRHTAAPVIAFHQHQTSVAVGQDIANCCCSSIAMHDSSMQMTLSTFRLKIVSRNVNTPKFQKLNSFPSSGQSSSGVALKLERPFENTDLILMASHCRQICFLRFSI